MSCRVFNRTLEEFILLRLRDLLMVEGYRTIATCLVETDKNRHVHKLFERLGFENCGTIGRDVSFRFELSADEPWNTFVQARESSVEMV